MGKTFIYGLNSHLFAMETDDLIYLVNLALENGQKMGWLGLNLKIGRQFKNKGLV
ncbi:MAG: hypothetical protein WCZ90_06285 [Melioribacteraceae bacterium]